MNVTICDRCKADSGIEKNTVKIKDKTKDLCKDCFDKINRWFGTVPEKKATKEQPMASMFNAEVD